MYIQGRTLSQVAPTKLLSYPYPILSLSLHTVLYHLLLLPRKYSKGRPQAVAAGLRLPGGGGGGGGGRGPSVQVAERRRFVRG